MKSMAPSLSAEDRAAILDLLARYSWTLDAGDPEALSAIFTPDAEYGINGRLYQGLDAILEYIRELMGRDNWAGSQHYNSQIVFEESNSAQCKLRSYSMIVYRLRDETSHFRMLASYLDTCVKTGDRWFIRTRLAEVWNPVTTNLD
jgi:uncharacterized protein (TIGR02246 family)